VRDVLRSDAAFDALYPADVRKRSANHWTPVAVALQAAELLAPEDGMRVLDVGAGGGKLCCVGALATPAHTTWAGIEQDPQLVDVARELATRLELADRVAFHHGDMAMLDWDEFDSIYLFNPFESDLVGENYVETRQRWALFGREVTRVEDWLAQLASGTRVVTYHGFGGEMPDSYSLAAMEHIGSGPLALWIKRPNRNGMTLEG